MAANKEFAGHTEHSLRQRFNGDLKKSTQLKFKVGHGEVTLGHVAEYCRQVHGEGKVKMSAKKEERQQTKEQGSGRRTEDGGDEEDREVGREE